MFAERKFDIQEITELFKEGRRPSVDFGFEGDTAGVHVPPSKHEPGDRCVRFNENLLYYSPTGKFKGFSETTLVPTEQGLAINDRVHVVWENNENGFSK